MVFQKNKIDFPISTRYTISKPSYTMSTKKIITLIQEQAPTLPYTDRIKRLSLFGSMLHGTHTKKSDVDILIELKQPTGYFGLAKIQRALEKTIQRPVDLVTPNALSKYFRTTVLKEAKTIYESKR